MSATTGLPRTLHPGEVDTRLAAPLGDLVAALVAIVIERVAPPAIDPVERLLSVSAAAQHLGVSRTTTYQLIGSGELRSLKVRGRRLVPTSAIIDVAEGRTR